MGIGKNLTVNLSLNIQLKWRSMTCIRFPEHSRCTHNKSKQSP